MLVLVGLGLWDEKDISLKGLEEAKACDIFYLEEYTSKLFGATKQDLESLFGKEIQKVKRDFIESGEILNYAVRNKVALLIPGDPMVATTHNDLILRAKEKGINVKIIHNASIYSAIGETGLQIYKFGKSATIPFWEENFKPTSFFDVVKENQEKGLHTLLFLDIKAEEDRYMNPNKAMEILLGCGMDENMKMVVCSRLGSEKELIRYGAVVDLRNEDFGSPLHVLVVPGKLHKKEKEFLESF